jgi:sterol desaturase/sphingolipid hydroxylase (fatty acid hydroxylase superfamily)
MSVALLITLVLASSGLCMGLTSLAFALLPSRRIREEKGRKLEGPAYLFRLAANMVLSTSLIYLATHLLQGRLFTTSAIPFWRGALEVIGILLVYDFLYYFLHRYPFHQWGLLMRVHAVHHKARHPIAIDSLYLHPVENVLGLALLLFCTWLVGPVNLYAFGVCFFVYSWLNILVHGGVDLGVPYVGLLARKHDLHHTTMRAGNFASLSPLPDLLFGTAE